MPTSSYQEILEQNMLYTVCLTSNDHPYIGGAYFLASRRVMILLFSSYHSPLSGGWYKLKMELIAWAEAEI
jgi:hypothetical protein